MDKYTGLEIAVIGMAGRFPKADNIEEYWDNIINGKDCVSDFTEEELVKEGEDENIVKDPLYVKSNAYLEKKQFFDADFFGYRHEEAALMDPQIRVFHECCWEALEDSGYGKKDIKEKIGIFASGSSNPDWEVYAMLQNREQLVDDFSASHLRDIGYLASKVSYKLNLKGPVVFLQTACSSSLVAIHEACNSLLLGECYMSVAGGVSINNYSRKGYLYQPGMIFSKDGRCKPFDIDSSGTIPGEGAGVVVLKRLKDAIKDKDHIYAIIKGSAVNNDGSEKAGFTAPSVRGQVDVIKKAQKVARASADSIGYIEAHGTATVLGDPIEIEALNQAFGNLKEKSCAIGSVKANFGHLDVAAGVAGFIKVVLLVANKKIPPCLHYNSPNPKIEFENGPFYVNKVSKSWEALNTPIRAGVSSFGIGGTNAHIIVEEAPAAAMDHESRPNQLLTFSAKTKYSLQRNVQKYIAYLNEKKGDALPDIAYTLNTGRSRFSCRAMVVCKNPAEALELLTSKQFAEFESMQQHEDLQNIVFMFSGQGTQYATMCQDLYLQERKFKGWMDECLEICKRYSDKDFFTALFPANELGSLEEMYDTELAQPLLFMVEYALANLLMSWGIKPHYMIGHSVGEYVAACISGVFSLEDALKLVIRRGRLMTQLPKGSMLSVSIPENELNDLLSKAPLLDIAVINSVGSFVVSGKSEDVDAFEALLNNSNYQCKQLRTSHAFHSRMMEPILVAFEEEFDSVKINPPQIPYMSNIDGQVAEYNEIKKASYWSRHIRHAVDFLKGTELLLQKGDAIFIEIGPGRALCNYVGQHPLVTERHHLVNTVRQRNQKINDQAYLLEKLGQLWLRAVNVDWSSFYGDENRNKLSLPTYSFEETVFPVNVNVEKLLFDGHFGKMASKKTDSAGIYIPVWQRTLLPNPDKDFIEKKLTFLLFPGNESLSYSMASLLRKSGHTVIEIQKSDAFNFIDESLLEANLSDVDRFSGYLAEMGIVIDHIIYNAALDETAGMVNYQAIEKKLNDGYISLCHIAQSLAKLNQHEKVSITVFNNYVAKVLDDDELNSLKACALGPVKVMPLELLNVNCKLVDIPYPFISNGDAEAYLPKLVNELFFEPATPLVAYRYKQRWKTGFDLYRQDKQLESGVKIVENAVYIITGGFGGMGFSITKDLVHNHKANVILIHRSPFPPQEAWPAYLVRNGNEKNTDSTVIGQINDILAMQASGVKVDLFQADVSKEQDVKSVLTLIGHKYKEIHGLIWAAGEVDMGGIIQNRNVDELLHYTNSKIKGIALFEQYLDFSKLQFIALFSSIGNVFYQAKFGQVAYNAANEFLENYAPWLQRKFGVHAFSINWCDWLDVGMTVKTIQRNKKGVGLEVINAEITDGISPAEGVNIFHQCLEGKIVACTIYRGDLNEAIRDHRQSYDGIKSDMINDAMDAPESDNEVTSVEDRVRDIFSQFFNKPFIREDDDFFELGGDSLEGMTLVARINKKCSTKISIGDLYKHSTVKSLSSFIAGKETTVVSEIPVSLLKRNYVLSSPQKRMYFLQLMDLSSTAYNEVQTISIKGSVDKNRIRAVFKQLIERHEILRTKFEVADNSISQIVLDHVDFDILEFQANEEEINSVVDAFVCPFDLSKAPLLRVGLVTISSFEKLLLFDIHHIINDGVSREILVKDFMHIYNGEHLKPLRIQYKDFAEWQQSAPQQRAILKQKEFWLKQFETIPEVLNLPADFSRPLIKGSEGSIVKREYSLQKLSALRKTAEREAVSVYMLLLSVYQVVLSKLSNQEDIVIGTPTAGRIHADLEGVMGMFVNTLPLRNFSGSDLAFTDFLKNVKENVLACFDNQEYQYEDMIESLSVNRDMSRNPLFDVMFNYENFKDSNLTLDGLEIGTFEKEHKISKFDLTLMVTESEDKLFVDFEYATSLYKEETIIRIADYFERTVNIITNDTRIKLKDISILDDAQREKLLYGFNEVSVYYPPEVTIIDLFERQVEKTPGNIALVFEGKELTYAELNSRSNLLAKNIRNYYHSTMMQELKPNTLVALFLDRGVEMVVGILGVLKAGAAYVPIDIAYPQQRIDFILGDIKAELIISQREISQHSTISSRRDKVIFVDDRDLPLQDEDVNNLPPIAAATDLAYVIYTSGTTGNPKGVLQTHYNIVRLFKSTHDQFAFCELDVWTLFHAYVFDFSVWEIWGPLIFGGKLVIVSQSQTKDIQSFYYLCEQHKVNVLNQTPSAFYKFTDIALKDVNKLGPPFRYIIFGGESLNNSHLKSWWEFAAAHKLTTKLINMYGITETTVHVTFKELTHSDNNVSNIGKPIPDLKAYVLDVERKPVPVGVIGELYVGGAGLARGYLNNNELTQERFIENIFATDLDIKHGHTRIYKTGDLVRWLSNGELEYIGRNDDQVKIRGHRIELKEIEYRLNEYEDIRRCFALVKDRSGVKYIVAYYICVKPISETDLKIFLGKVLPDYMIPSYFVQIEEFPLTINGKINKNELPNPELKSTEDYIAPSGELEEQLVEIWAGILELDKTVISINKNFFELGGNSLDIITLNQKINNFFNASITVAEMFGLTTILEIKNFLMNGNGQRLEKAIDNIEFAINDATEDLKLLEDF
ncbi:MAG: amino acid adenylation domain-containing protein [Ferruginibacter sp.]|nr:amino acid adenylation domain-containing protein [Ferruginibacter sp.]